MDPIDSLRVLLEEYGADPRVAVLVYTEDGIEHSIIETRLEDTGRDLTIAINVVQT